MRSHPTKHDKANKRPQPKRVKTTGASPAVPLAVRARKRKLELERVLAKLSEDDARARGDIEIALASFDAMLTGDDEHLTEATAAELSRLLENTKHLGEVVGRPRGRMTH